jgi:hypothetical protein
MTFADLSSLATRLTGELHYDRTMRTLYATDASEYQELPARRRAAENGGGRERRAHLRRARHRV